MATFTINRSADDKIIKGLTDIKESIGHVEQSVEGLLLQTRYDAKKRVFVANVEEKINDLQKSFNGFAQNPNRQQKKSLMSMCKKRNMDSVLQIIYQTIAERSADEKFELLDGGAR